MVQKFRPAVPGLSRREVVKLGAAGAAFIPLSALGFPALAEDKPEQLIIASGGGALDEAYRKAYWDTFTAKTGIKIITTEYVGLAQIQAMQESNNVTVDVINIDAAEAPVAGKKGWLVPIDWSLSDRSKVLPVAAQDDHVYAEVAAKVLAWNTDTFPAGKAPKDWTCMWDLDELSRQAQPLEAGLPDARGGADGRWRSSRQGLPDRRRQGARCARQDPA